MDIEKITRIKEIAIKAMFSDDELMNVLVLKGGNALDIIYKIAQRSSIDLDFSMEREFPEDKLDEIESKIKNVLKNEYNDNGFSAFDINFEKKPRRVSEDLKLFWGGYTITFKVLDKLKELKRGNNIENRRRNAEVIGPLNQKVFNIEISKYEFCSAKKSEELDDMTIYVYTPTMIVMEKLRAICQQTDEYRQIVRSHKPVPRPKDFFDIYTVTSEYMINLFNEENLQMLKTIFEAKKVPFSLLHKIKNYKEMHESGYSILKDIVKESVELYEFDFYFNYVLRVCKKLESFGIK
jgi:hypothetical protein